jgi:hypothetical protein
MLVEGPFEVAAVRTHYFALDGRARVSGLCGGVELGEQGVWE